MIEGQIIIGKYLLEDSEDGGIWISLVGDGEGGEFDAEKLEAVIEKFYGDSF